MNIKFLLKGIATYVPGLYKPASRGTGGTISARYCYSTNMKKMNIGIVSSIGQANARPLLNLTDIIRGLSNKTYLIVTYDEETIFPDTLEQFKIFKINRSRGKKCLSTRIFNYACMQFRMAYTLVKSYKKIDVCIFYMGDSLLLPLLTAKILGKKIILALGGFIEKEIELKGESIIKVNKLFKKVNLYITDIILLYSETLIKEWNLERYRNKISIAHEHFLDFDTFKVQNSLNDRDNIVGYIGVFNNNKNIMNFVKSIQYLKSERIEFLIGGAGQLRNEVEKFLNDVNFQYSVKYAGWIPHQKLPDYLNELRLLVIPSYSEGLPNIMLEAMACGTPVLAAPVGAIPDVIKDKENGFILEDNTPQGIAEGITKALGNPNLDQIAMNARVFVENEFTIGVAVRQYRKVLEDFAVSENGC